MRQSIIILLALLPAALSLGSCSVKENRSACPCELIVRPEEALKTDGNVLVSVVQDGEVVKQGMLSGEDFESGKCRMLVKRRPSVVTVFTGITSMSPLPGEKLDIRYDNECDEVYSCSQQKELDGDICDCPLSLHKNFARLNLTILNLPENSGLCVSGTVRGYDLMYAAPYEGVFNCYPVLAEGTNDCCIRLPRQVDDKLTLSIVNEGEVLRTVLMGRMIVATGYSFEDEDLLDIYMTLDMEKAQALLGLEDWEQVIFQLDR